MNAKALIDLQQYFQVVHHVPGRIRVKFDMALATNPQAKEFLNGNGGQSLPGITNYRLNFMAQSIVIEYDRGRIAPNLVQELFTTKDPQRLGAIVNLWVSST